MSHQHHHTYYITNNFIEDRIRNDAKQYQESASSIDATASLQLERGRTRNFFLHFDSVITINRRNLVPPTLPDVLVTGR